SLIMEFFLSRFFFVFYMLPFFVITLWLKNLVTPIIATATVVLGNVALANEDLGVLFPWTSSYLIASGDIEKYKYSTEIAIIIIFVVFFFGIFTSFVYFKKQDIK